VDDIDPWYIETVLFLLHKTNIAKRERVLESLVEEPELSLKAHVQKLLLKLKALQGQLE
jgi:hypothetical protein